MAIPLTGAGSLFVRLGHLMGGLADINALRGNTATARVLSGASMPARTQTTLEGDYQAGTAIPQVLDGVETALVSFFSGLDTLPRDFQTRAQNTLKAMYGIDRLGMSASAPLSTYSQISLLDAVRELIRQMESSSDDVQAVTAAAGAQTALGSPAGNPTIVVSLKNGRGKLLQLIYPETMLFRVVTDSFAGAVAGNESMQVTTPPQVSDTLSHLYPAGSGVNTILNLVDGTGNNSRGNLLYNSDFQVASTSNYPDNWVADVGSPGTTIFQGTGVDSYTSGGGHLKFTGDGGGTLTSIYQQFNKTVSTTAGAGGTPATLRENLVYHVNGYAKVSSVPAAGVLQIALVDGTGTVINDDEGTANSFTVSAPGLTTSYANFNGAFRLPKNPPTTIRLRIKLTTAIDNTVSIFVGRLSMAEVSANGNGIYAGGPMVTVHSGNTKVINGLVPDQWTVAFTNSYETTGSGLMQLMFDQMFGLRTLATPALQLPYDAAPTIADSLIT